MVGCFCFFFVIPAVATNVFKRIMLTAGWRLLIVNVADGVIVSTISHSNVVELELELKLTTEALGTAPTMCVFLYANMYAICIYIGTYIYTNILICSHL